MQLQEQILGEVKKELDDKKRNAVKKFVVEKLEEITDAKDEIENIKQQYKEDIAEQEESIKEAEDAIKAVESGDFEDALTSDDKITELPITTGWVYYSGAGYAGITLSADG